MTKRSIIAAVFTVVYLAMTLGVIGWRSDHLSMVILVVAMIILDTRTYEIVIVLSPFALFWVSYDFLGAFPNYLFSPVHVSDLYQAEIKLFGIPSSDGLITLCEWFQSRTHDLLSLFAGGSYILWMPAPMTYAIYLYARRRNEVVRFGYTFLLANLIGYICYYSFPAAPPWYYINYGPVMDTSVPGSEGLLSEFDRIIGIPVFRSIYAKGGNPFAAIPSLHSAYPMVGLLTAVRLRQPGWIVFFVVLSVGTWFAAVYSQHHYVIDVLLGIICAILSYAFMIILRRMSVYRSFEQLLLREVQAGAE
ncbi:MAG: phosphatase PAP2 family protein [Bacteroidota bacterium]